jgi:hypothetical protein
MLCSDPYDGVRYFGQLKFPLEKHTLPTPDQTLATIAEVLTVQPADDSASTTQTPGPPSEPVPPASANLRLPASYTSSQASADQLQLKADNSFSLEEGGQTYHGTFALNGNNLELTISESGAKTTATIQGNNLTDSSGQTWVLRVPASGAPAFVNEDVIKMAKAGFDDGLIIAKIKSSKCQFETSTDALIGLKQSGVSPAVIAAMVGAGKWGVQVER